MKSGLSAEFLGCLVSVGFSSFGKDFSERSTQYPARNCTQSISIANVG